MKNKIIEVFKSLEEDVRLYERGVETQAIKKMNYSKAADKIIKLIEAEKAPQQNYNDNKKR